MRKPLSPVECTLPLAPDGEELRKLWMKRDFMCCPDCGQAQHPTLEHVLWYCNSYAHLRTVAPPSCPLARRLGWSHETSISQSLSLLRHMGKIREAEVINRMRRVRLQQARVIRGGGRAVSHVSTKELPCHTQVNEIDECSWLWSWCGALWSGVAAAGHGCSLALTPCIASL